MLSNDTQREMGPRELPVREIGSEPVSHKLVEGLTSWPGSGHPARSAQLNTINPTGIIPRLNVFHRSSSFSSPFIGYLQSGIGQNVPSSGSSEK
jgi:hypothetical protein